MVDDAVLTVISFGGAPATSAPTMASGMHSLPTHSCEFTQAWSAQSTSPFPSSSMPLLQISIFVLPVDSVTVVEPSAPG